jgi:Sushi repeat (SCR repeat)
MDPPNLEENSLCIAETKFIMLSFKEATIYSISWVTNLKRWTESRKEQHLIYYQLQSQEWQYLGKKIDVFERNNLRITQVAINEPIPKVTGVKITSGRPHSVCRLQITGIQLSEKCEEPDSPVHGQHLWNRNDSVANFKCDDNFTLTSHLPLNCVDGKWTGPQPNCKLFKIES